MVRALACLIQSQLLQVGTRSSYCHIPSSHKLYAYFDKHHANKIVDFYKTVCYFHKVNSILSQSYPGKQRENGGQTIHPQIPKIFNILACLIRGKITLVLQYNLILNSNYTFKLTKKVKSNLI